MEYQVTKIPGPYVFNDDDQLTGVIVPDGHRVEMLKGKGDKGKPLTCYLVPDLSSQFVLEVAHDDPQAAKIIGAMVFELIDRNQKLRLNEYDDGESAAQTYVLDVGALAERFFIDGRSLGVKQAMIEEWITTKLRPYMVARIAKNAGFTQSQRDSLVGALTEKFLIASTRDNETKDKRGNVLFVPKDQLIDLKKRLEQYASDENNMLERTDEYDSLVRRIDKHVAMVRKELETTNADF